jgi:hypothetical protein
MAVFTEVLNSCRVSIGDGPTDNLARNENLNNNDLGNVINGENTVFAVTNYPIVPNGVQTVKADNVVLTNPSGYTVNEPIGEIDLVAPPVTYLFATYYYYLMPDTTWEEFILQGLEKCNLSTGTDNVALDLLTVPEGLLLAVKQFSCAAFCYRLAGQTGLWYNQKLQEREESRAEISKKYMTLAHELAAQATTSRDDFYKGDGTQFKPALAISGRSPRPYTPYR